MPHRETEFAACRAVAPAGLPGRAIVCLALLCLVLPGTIGCQAFGKKRDPHADLPGTPLADSSLPPPSERDPYGYEDPNRGLELDEDLTWWERTVENLSPERIGARIRRLVGRGPNRAIAEQKLDEADQLFAQQRYAEADKRYKQAADRWPDSDIEEDALFMRGECAFFQDHYATARNRYDKVLVKHTNSRHLATIAHRDFSIARYWEELGRTHPGWLPNAFDRERPFLDINGEARELYETIQKHASTEDVADDAIMALANWHFVRSRFEEAAYEYHMLRTRHRGSEFEPQANLLELQARLASYQGYQYDGEPLAKAEELIDAGLTQYSRELESERDRILDARTWVREELARRDWESAEYYYRTGYNRAARFYYDIVVRDHADTPFAELAQQRLDETYGKRPYPPNYFKWLTNAFPNSRQRR